MYSTVPADWATEISLQVHIPRKQHLIYWTQHQSAPSKVSWLGNIHLMRWLTNFYDFTFKWTATAAIGIHPTKAWLSQMVNFKNAIWTSGHFEEWYAIKFCFKLGKNATEAYGTLQTAFGASCMNQAWVFEWHKRFNEGSLWEMKRCVGGVRKSIHQSWLAKRLGLRLLCWGFKGVQEEIPSEEVSTLQIGSVAFPPGQCSILVTDYLTKMGIMTVLHPPYSPDLAPCDFCFFPKLRGCRYETIETMKEAVTKVIDTLTREDFHGSFQKLLERYNKCIEVGRDYLEGD